MRPTSRPKTAFWLRIEAWMQEAKEADPLKRDVTQTDIAQALGVTSQAVTGWKLGPQVPTMENVKALSDYTGIPFGELVELVGEQVAFRRGQKTRNTATEAQDAAGEENQDPEG